MADNANDRQVGGDHYANSQGVQHWDWVTFLRMPYLLGNATKYVTRYNRKGKPKEDLEKAIHYIEKALQEHESGFITPIVYAFPEVAITKQFVQDNGLSRDQELVCQLCAAWRTPDELRQAVGLLRELLQTASEDV